MDIYPTNPVSNTQGVAVSTSKCCQNRKTAVSDHVETSREYKWLARSLPKLKEMLQPRSEVINKTDVSAANDAEFDDETIDRILSQL